MVTPIKSAYSTYGGFEGGLVAINPPSPDFHWPFDKITQEKDIFVKEKKNPSAGALFCITFIKKLLRRTSLKFCDMNFFFLVSFVVKKLFLKSSNRLKCIFQVRFLLESCICQKKIFILLYN